MVLDGQQRLQSLYLSLAGTIDGKMLHFDVLERGNGGGWRQFPRLGTQLPGR